MHVSVEQGQELLREIRCFLSFHLGVSLIAAEKVLAGSKPRSYSGLSSLRAITLDPTRRQKIAKLVPYETGYRGALERASPVGFRIVTARRSR
jgi:hypothetical protein